MKKCKDCGQEKSLTEFYIYRHGERITYYARCKTCEKKRLREKVGQATKNSQRRARVNKTQEIVNELKNISCADCKIFYPPYVMDFDHVKGVKILSVAKMISQCYALEDIMAEIAKCEVVCSNCHRIRTHMRKNNESTT